MTSSGCCIPLDCNRTNWLSVTVFYTVFCKIANSINLKLQSEGIKLHRVFPCNIHWGSLCPYRVAMRAPAQVKWPQRETPNSFCFRLLPRHTTSSHRQVLTWSHHQIITSSYHHIFTSSYHHVITSSQHHTIISSHNHTMTSSDRHMILLPQCHHTVLGQDHPAIMSSFHHIIPWSYHHIIASS